MVTLHLPTKPRPIVISTSYPRTSATSHAFDPSASDSEKCQHCGHLRGAHPEHFPGYGSEPIKGYPKLYKAEVAKEQ